MRITFGEYDGHIMRPQKREVTIRRRGHAKRVAKTLNPASGIWMVSLYRFGKIVEQYCCPSRGSALYHIRHAQKTGTLNIGGI